MVKYDMKEKFRNTRWNRYRKFKNDKRTWELIEVVYAPSPYQAPDYSQRMNEWGRRTMEHTEHWNNRGYDTVISEQEDEKHLIYVATIKNKDGKKGHTWTAKRYGKKGTFLRWSTDKKDKTMVVVGGIAGVLVAVVTVMMINKKT